MIPKLSFCISCKNRFHQISYTLPKNLDDNRLHQEWIEFILMDFGSVDGLREWVISHFQEYLKSGYLKYYYTEELSFWHASVAKNMAHKLANHNILVNLDCDNYTGYLGGQFVIRQFLQSRDIVLHQFGGNLHDGSYGRISMLKKYFEAIGGYDESFEPMSYQDIDLINRLKQIGLRYRLQSNTRFCRAIANTKSESILHTNSTLVYNEMYIKNGMESRKNIASGRLIVHNQYHIWKNLRDYTDNKVIL